MLDLIWMVLLAAVIMRWHHDYRQLTEAREEIASFTGMIRTGSAWSIQQILGAPDTFAPGDRSTAWASESQDSQREWIILEFPQQVDLAKIVVHETYNPGAIDRIAVVDFTGLETDIWSGKDPTPATAAMGKSTFTFKNSIRTRRIKLYLDSPAVPGWNEIDAVALHGTDGSVQWASDAWASSAYGANQELPMWFWP